MYTAWTGGAKTSASAWRNGAPHTPPRCAARVCSTAAALEPLKATTAVKDLGDLLLGQYFLDTANVALIFTAVFERTLKKYGPRGYRYVLFEAGHAAQNASLLAGESGVASVCVGGFRDGRLNEYLGLDGRSEAALYVVGLGYAGTTTG